MSERPLRTAAIVHGTPLGHAVAAVPELLEEVLRYKRSRSGRQASEAAEQLLWPDVSPLVRSRGSARRSLVQGRRLRSPTE